ncbi:acyltransferase LovD [Achaetomium macrosporum]|uniref:Acyltransferase LovD n=1 Tax=Achaetomium macrosporum TaxID=79813 RepID=A0AAN7C1G1_9PEZI|nr:acyltransferase LovD [Achaetomium macrosporum]
MADQTIETAYGTALASGALRGAVICASNTTGDFTYNLALGSRTLLSGETRPQQLDDILYLASATKLITTICALQCVEDGLLTLTGDVSRFIPELTRQPVLTESGTLEPIAADHPITLEQLLAHTSGAAYDFLVPRLMQWRKENQAPLAEGATRPVEEAFAYPLAFQPGTGWMYGAGLDWAGRIVERVTGMTLGEFVQKRVCAPLGIAADDAQFYPVKGDAVRERLVDLNPDDPKGLGLAVLNGTGEVNKRSRGHFGGHGLFMTGRDYIKVLRSLLANDGKLLRPETVEEMFRNRIGPEAEAGHRATMEGHPAADFFRVGVDPRTKVGYGLSGLLTLEDVEGWYGEGTLTWGGGMTFAWFIDRKNGLCGLGAPQASLPVDVGVVTELKQTFRHDIYRKFADWKKEQQQES